MRKIVQKILEEVKQEPIENDSGHLLNDGIIDSFDVINIVQALEDEFDIIISAKFVIPENFKDIDSICEFVAQIRAEAE